MDTEYQQSIINEAIDEKYIDATLELLQLTKQIGDALIEKYIINPLKDIGFERHLDDNGALWRDLNESYAIVIKTDDRAYWRKVWIGISPKMDMSSLQRNLIVLQMSQPKIILMVGVGFLIMQITTGIILLNIQQLKTKKY